MALPQSKFARNFYRTAMERRDDAEYLFNGERLNGAVYLAGYAVECMLKSLILASAAPAVEARLRLGFRGQSGHDYESLLARYMQQRGQPFPRLIQRAFVTVRVWSTDLRYKPGIMKREDAAAFMDAAKLLVDAIDGRL